MAKLLFMLGTFLLIGLTLLGLRQHRLELTRHSALLTQEIEGRSRPTLWGQEYRIAGETNPVVLPEQLKNCGLDLQAEPTTAPSRGAGVDSSGDLVAPLRQRSTGTTSRSRH